MGTKLLVCTVDKILDIPKGRSGFPNTERLTFEFKAGVPLEVPDYIADTYQRSYPKIYTIVEPGVKVPLPVPPIEKETEAPKAPFDAEEYLLEHFTATEEELKELSKAELIEVAKVLNLTAPPNIGQDKLAVKIAQELKIRNESSPK